MQEVEKGGRRRRTPVNKRHKKGRGVNNETSSKERKESEEEYERSLRGERESRKRNSGRRVIGRKEDMMEWRGREDWRRKRRGEN
jgi:hypothetical protein